MVNHEFNIKVLVTKDTCFGDVVIHAKVKVGADTFATERRAGFEHIAQARLPEFHIKGMMLRAITAATATCIDKCIEIKISDCLEANDKEFPHG